MTEQSDMRCPYCNGVGTLPAARIRQIEADRDEAGVRKELVSLLWGALCDVSGTASKKGVTLEKLQAATRSARSSVSRLMTLDRI